MEFSTSSARTVTLTDLEASALLGLIERMDGGERLTDGESGALQKLRDIAKPTRTPGARQERWRS